MLQSRQEVLIDAARANHLPSRVRFPLAHSPTYLKYTPLRSWPTSANRQSCGPSASVTKWAAEVSPTQWTRASLITAFASHFSGSYRNRSLSLDLDHSTRNDTRPSSDGPSTSELPKLK